MPGTLDGFTRPHAGILNFAAVPRGPVSFLSAWPTGLARPLISTLNDPTGTVVANAAIVPAGSGGSIDVFATHNTDLVIDIDGYFAPPGQGGLSLYNVVACRVFDSRLPGTAPAIAGSLDVNITASACSIPASAQAFVLNASVVPVGGLGFMTLWPAGQPWPLASTLNASDGVVTSNMALVTTTNGSISILPSNPTHVILDISGYFAQ